VGVKRYAGLLLVGGALLATTAAVTLYEGDARTWAFRIVVAAVGLVAVRALARWHQAHPPAPDPLRRPRRTWLPRRRTLASTRRGSERVLHLATVGAGDAHRGLRPLLQEIADERLRAHHGVSLEEPRAASLLAPATWELLRPDRPAPHDVRAPGLSPAAIDHLLTDLEIL
jgi:hypothetical protein